MVSLAFLPLTIFILNGGQGSLLPRMVSSLSLCGIGGYWKFWFASLNSYLIGILQVVIEDRTDKGQRLCKGRRCLLY